jgi:hypothetical protein
MVARVFGNATSEAGFLPTEKRRNQLATRGITAKAGGKMDTMLRN